MSLTIKESLDFDIMTQIMMDPEIRSGLQLPDNFFAGWLWKEDSLFLLIEDGDEPAGFIWLEKEESGMMSHIMLLRRYRGATALKIIRSAINWVFLNRDWTHVMAHPPFRHSYLLCKMLGFYDVGEEDYDCPILGKGKRRVIRLDKSDWFKSLLQKPFFITGYPRSGTAWYSNLLTCTPALCLHEGSALGPQIGLWLYQEEHRGLSDSMVMMKTRLIEENPHSPVVLIKRDKEQAKNSLLTWFGKDIPHIHTLFDQMEEKFAWLEQQPNVLVVDFSEAFEQSSIEKVWRHCLPKIPFDRIRAEFLRALNVQQNLNYVMTQGIPNPIDYTPAMALPESPNKALL